MEIDPKYKVDSVWYDNLFYVENAYTVLDDPLITVLRECNGQLYLQHFADSGIELDETWWIVYPVPEDYKTADLHKQIFSQPTIIIVHDTVDENNELTTTVYEMPIGEFSDGYTPDPGVTLAMAETCDWYEPAVTV